MFERSSLAPKSTPLDWVTYFKKTIMPPHLFFEPSYCLQWLNFFRIELNEGDFSEAKNLFSEKNKTDNVKTLNDHAFFTLMTHLHEN